MGMLATTMNALALADVLQGVGVDAVVQTAIDMVKIAEPYTRNKAVAHLKKGRVVIFACGTGNPFFSTDTGAVLKAAEIGAEVILLAKNIDGVYDADPAKVKDAKKFDSITYDEVLARGLAVMDTAATALAKENNIPVIVFAVKDPDNITKVLCGEKIGSYVGVK
jgi:uridylate kinase